VAAALGSITVTLSLGVGSAPAHEVASLEVPVSARVEGADAGTLRVALSAAPDAFGKAVASALRDVADRFDPDVDLLAADLAPGAVLLSCPSCPATIAGWPGDSIEHADDGAHVMAMTYGSGS
jgi:hypothetical protein